MTEQSGLSRRQFLKVAGGAAALAGGAFGRQGAAPRRGDRAERQQLRPVLGGDRRVDLPAADTGDPAVPPGRLAPSPFTTYIFGFRNVTNLSETQKLNQKNHAQHSAPLMWVNQFDPAHPVDFNVQVTNLGLALRPDLFDAHTLHWHGFRNVIPFFDGEPTGSVAVPTGRNFTYVYRPRDPGTYMYHCHVEDVEHVHMGMTGLVFVRPLQDGQPHTFQNKTFTKFMYNDGDGSTGFDREFAMFLSEVWAEAHWADAHIQLPEWSDYRADFSLLNGRVYPDTIAPNAQINAARSINTLDFDTDANGGLVAQSAHPELQYQPHSSLVNCNAGTVSRFDSRTSASANRR